MRHNLSLRAPQLRPRPLQALLIVLSQVYEFASLLEDGGGGGAHYPVLDLPFRTKLAAVTWNTYLKSHLLAADYAGIATLVDASAGVEVITWTLIRHAMRYF
jgi:hypothetical protein